MKIVQRLTAAAVIAALGLPARAGHAADASPASAGAKNTPELEQAREHFNQGLKLYRDGDFDAALVQFERAYAIKPNYRVLYNVAQTYFQLRDYVGARDAMRRYLHDGGTEIESERRQAASRDLADLERRIGKVRLSVNVDGAAVFVDGKRVGTTPLSEPIAVNEGQRTIAVEEPIGGARQRLIRLAGGEEVRLTLDFELVKTPLPSAATPGRPRAHSTGLGAGFWVSAVGALALGAGAGVTGVLTLRKQDENQEQRRRLGVSKSELERSRDQAKIFALTTDILGGAAIVCAGVAGVVLLTRPARGETELSLDLGPQSAALRGRF